MAGGSRGSGAWTLMEILASPAPPPNVSAQLGFAAFFVISFRGLPATSVQTPVEGGEAVSLFIERMNKRSETLIPNLPAGSSRDMMDALGEAGSGYRSRIYEYGFGGTMSQVSTVDFKQFLSVTQEFLEHSLRANRRSDALYHSYNLLRLEPGRAYVDRLYEMR